MNMRDLDTRGHHPGCPEPVGGDCDCRVVEATTSRRPRKTGDWRSILGYYVGDAETARREADAFLARFPDARVRIRHWSTLGYAVQTFVERTPR